MNAELGQRLLASEASPERQWAALNQGGPSSVFSPAETRRFESADLEALHSALALGVQVWDNPPGDLPPACFAWGDTGVLRQPMVGVVGTRGASSYGRAMTRHFAARLATAGCSIVSGGAIGIDAAAHEGAMDAGGGTVVVLPCGVERCYPSRHQGLFARVREKGCLLSPFACGSREHDHRLIVRNRVLSALVDALIVVEAPAESGSLVTAREALRLGKPVFVVPGPAGDSFRGSHSLVREGRELVDDPDQVLSAMRLEGASPDRSARYEGDESKVLGVMQPLPMNAELVAELAELPVDQVLAALTLLELDGAVVRSAEGYARCP